MFVQFHEVIGMFLSMIEWVDKVRRDSLHTMMEYAIEVEIGTKFQVQPVDVKHAMNALSLTA